MALKRILFWLPLIALAVLQGALMAHAADILPLPGTDGLSVPTPIGNTAVEKTENFLGPLARNIRLILGTVASLYIVIAGITIVISGDNEETVKTQRTGIVYAVVGLMVISLSGPIAAVFDFRQGNIIESPDTLVARAQLFDQTTQLVLTYIRYLLAGLATLMFVSAGAAMVANPDNEETVSRSKKNMALGAAGLMVVFTADLLIRRIFYVAEFNDAASRTVVAINQNELLRQMIAFINILVSFVGPIMMLGIVAGGLLYVTSFGNEERQELARKIIQNSVIGVIIIYGAFALVTTAIAGVF